MTRGQTRAYRLRHAILAAGILFAAAAVGFAVAPVVSQKLTILGFGGLVGTPLWIGTNSVSVYLVNVAGVFAVVLLMQWALLRPGRRLTIRLTSKGRPMWSAVLAAAFMAMMLTVGLGAMILELGDWWAPLVESLFDPAPSYGLWGIWAAVFVIWGAWAAVFFMYWRGSDRYTQLTRMLRGLIAGSLVEAVIAVPVHVWATKQRDCYCARGTYTTLVFVGVVLLIAFGPGIVLLYKREAYRRAKLSGRFCLNCGYDLRGKPDAASCPECGLPVAPQ